MDYCSRYSSSFVSSPDSLLESLERYLYVDKILRDLKDSFWPFQLDQSKTPFLRAAKAAHCSDRSADVDKSGMEIASAKAARHRLEHGVWTSVRFGDIRRALSGVYALKVVYGCPTTCFPVPFR
ncbi:tetratricopeptide-like helical domain, Protein SirB1 [Artemisia annua]|uniref:Tetratricopeptide-like helical domain, Protein SirB1 n=1 Tax=Artemisia annua TaxID=35608 RepID=A0A2U1Q3R9_ARTAN|nr:tetratricopeptide-like helical domain, Protein SirB1 [Artemisia annua]